MLGSYSLVPPSDRPLVAWAFINVRATSMMAIRASLRRNPGARDLPPALYCQPRALLDGVVKKNQVVVPALFAVLLTTACGSSGTTAASPNTTVATVTPSFPAATQGLAPADARAKAAAVLHAADATWHDEFEKGVTLTGTAKIDWWTAEGGLPVVLAKANIQAFQDADQQFTADNEPASITAWSNVFSTLPGHVQD